MNVLFSLFTASVLHYSRCTLKPKGYPLVNRFLQDEA
jgi:hypothetical protein